jgi:hypothetical protein
MGENKKEIADKIRALSYKPLSKFPNISRPWDKLVKGMLRRPPAKRWTMYKILNHINHFRINMTDE